MSILNISYKEKISLPSFLFSIKALFAKKHELSADELENARKKAQVFNPESRVSADKIKVFTSSDPVLLERYYQLRHETFRNENGWQEYDGSESNYDKEGKIVIATNDKGDVIGGGRIMFSNLSEIMSSEYPEEGFGYKEIMKQSGIDTDTKFFSEVSAFVVAKEYRNRYITELMLEMATKVSAENKCAYVIGIGNILCCRDYRMIFKKLGYELTIRKDIPWIRKKMQNFSQGYMMIVPIITKN